MAARPQNLSRRSVVIAGWSNDELAARQLLGSENGALRASAVSALARMGALSIPDLVSALADGFPEVRSRALLALPARWSSTVATEIDLLDALDDQDPVVLELACFVAGECEPSPPGVVDRLADICTGHDDPLCRESAVAALGSLGDPSSVPAVLAACRDKATIRRRAVLALAAFDGPEVDAMMAAMATDVDWQVRQAAEELLAIE